MFRHAWLALLFFFASLPALGAPTVTIGPGAKSGQATVVIATGDTSDSKAIPTDGICSARVVIAGSDVVELWGVNSPATAATSGTQIGSDFTTSTLPTAPFTWEAGTTHVKVKGTTATTGGSIVIIDCNPRMSAGGGGEVNVENYNPGDSVSAIIANITDPSTTSFGAGITFGNPTSFPANPDTESDNQVGFFYNKEGVNASLAINQYEHAFDESWETAYRSTAGTSDRTWVEKNIDIIIPDNTSILTSINASFDPAVGETVYFSGGGQGKVISWSSPTLVWRQDYGATAAGETVIDDDGNPAHTAVVGAPSVVTSTFRPFQMEYDTLMNRAVWSWRSLSGSQTGAPHYEQDDLNSAFTIGSAAFNGRRKVALGVNTNPQLSSTFSVQDSALFNNQIMYLNYRSAGLDNLDAAVGTDDGWGGGSFRMLELAVDLSATNTHFQSPYLINVPTPSAFGTGSESAYPQVLRIATQGGRGTNGGPAIHILPQTCTNGGGFSTRCATDPGRFGNILLAGGNWNNGHITFGNEGGIDSYEEVEDHFWRDQTNEVLRISTGDAPDSETDGRPIVTGTNSTSHGPAIWAISDASGAAVFDTGTEVCATSGRALTCQDVLEFSTPGTPTDSTCATAHANGVKFIAMCY